MRVFLDASRLAGRDWDTATVTAIRVLATLETACSELDALEETLRAQPTKHDDAQMALAWWMITMDLRGELGEMIQRMCLNSDLRDAETYVAEAKK